MMNDSAKRCFLFWIWSLSLSYCSSRLAILCTFFTKTEYFPFMDFCLLIQNRQVCLGKSVTFHLSVFNEDTFCFHKKILYLCSQDSGNLESIWPSLHPSLQFPCLFDWLMKNAVTSSHFLYLAICFLLFLCSHILYIFHSSNQHLCTLSMFVRWLYVGNPQKFRKNHSQLSGKISYVDSIVYLEYLMPLTLLLIQLIWLQSIFHLVFAVSFCFRSDGLRSLPPLGFRFLL